MSSPVFGEAASSLTIVSLKDASASARYFGPAIDLFDARYPEFDDEGDNQEDFSAQLGDNGFMNALVDTSTGEVKALAAGVIVGEGLKTAALTYLVVAGHDDQAAKTLFVATANQLKEQSVQAVFVETFQQGKETDAHYERDVAERTLVKSLGAVTVPVTYGQPLEVEDGIAIPGLMISGVFFNNPTETQKGGISYSHLANMTKLYDPELVNPENIARLKLYETQMNAPQIAPHLAPDNG